MAAFELGARLRRGRQAAGLSVRDAASAAGLATSHYQRLEAGQVAAPTPSTLRALAGALSLPYAELARLAGYL